MLTLPAFEWVRPRTVDETLAALSDRPGETLVVAGGTDAVPNLKHRLHEPRRVVHLGGVRELHFVREAEDGLHLGALVTLAELSRHPVVLRDFPSLAKAAGLVAGPQLRNMGTLRGNLCLDTRCWFTNQTKEWRDAKGPRLKTGKDVCHAIQGSPVCVALNNADSPPALIALDATVTLASHRAERTLPLRDFYREDNRFDRAESPFLHNRSPRPEEQLFI